MKMYTVFFINMVPGVYRVFRCGASFVVQKFVQLLICVAQRFPPTSVPVNSSHRNYNTSDNYTSQTYALLRYSVLLQPFRQFSDVVPIPALRASGNVLTTSFLRQTLTFDFPSVRMVAMRDGGDMKADWPSLLSTSKKEFCKNIC